MRVVNRCQKNEVTDAPKLVATVAWHEALTCIHRASIDERNALWRQDAGASNKLSAAAAASATFRQRAGDTGAGRPAQSESLVTIERHCRRQHCSESSDHQYSCDVGVEFN